MSFWSYRPYVSVAERRAQAVREVGKLKKTGRVLTPVVIHGRKIAQSFWGKAWCDNLDRYSDYESRLPRGRSYVRNGSVIDLKVECGRVRALVIGSETYEVNIDIAVAAPSRWAAICDDCAGSVGSLIELLRGQISERVMERVCREGDGLFPSPSELKMSCSCPDWAGMCKHVAAALYGVGAYLDGSPEFLFTLRGVDHAQLIGDSGSLRVVQTGATSKRILADNDIAALFGIDMAPQPRAPVETNEKTDGEDVRPSRKLRAKPIKRSGTGRKLKTRQQTARKARKSKNGDPKLPHKVASYAASADLDQGQPPPPPRAPRKKVDALPSRSRAAGFGARGRKGLPASGAKVQ